MNITNEEYELTINELSNRWKNLAYINAEKTIRHELPKEILEKSLEKNVSTELTFCIHILVNDLREIIGGIRRGNEEKLNTKEISKSTETIYINGIEVLADNDIFIARKCM